MEECCKMWSLRGRSSTYGGREEVMEGYERSLERKGYRRGMEEGGKGKRRDQKRVTGKEEIQKEYGRGR